MPPPTETTSTTKSKLYTGGCHCGANRYSTVFALPLDDSESKVMRCNCSVCEKNGYLFSFTKVDDTKWEKGGPDAMTGYLFKDRKIKHHFCPTCGTSVYCSSNKEDFNPDTLGFNVRTIDEIDLCKLSYHEVDGKSL